MGRSWVIVGFLGLLLGAIFVQEMWAAEKYPTKPIECIVAVEAGGDGDVINRPVMKNVSQILGQPVMIVNKPGGGSTLGYRELLKAKPDGYTIGWGSSTLIANKLQGLSPFDYHDFTMLGSYASYFPVVVASTTTKRPFKTIQEVITLVVFSVFSVLYLHAEFRWNYVVAFGFLVGAVFFMFKA